MFDLFPSTTKHDVFRERWGESATRSRLRTHRKKINGRADECGSSNVREKDAEHGV